MNNQKGNIIDNLERAAFIVLFFLLVYIYSDNSVKKSEDTIQNELVFITHAKPVYAIVVDQVQLPSYQTSWVSVPVNANFKEFDTKVNSDNRDIGQRYILLQKTFLKIKPLTKQRFYQFHSSKDTEEPPILS
jgi:hypothetical protein